MSDATALLMTRLFARGGLPMCLVDRGGDLSWLDGPPVDAGRERQIDIVRRLGLAPSRTVPLPSGYRSAGLGRRLLQRGDTLTWRQDVSVRSAIPGETGGFMPGGLALIGDPLPSSRTVGRLMGAASSVLDAKAVLPRPLRSVTGAGGQGHTMSDDMSMRAPVSASLLPLRLVARGPGPVGAVSDRPGESGDGMPIMQAYTKVGQGVAAVPVALRALQADGGSSLPGLRPAAGAMVFDAGVPGSPGRVDLPITVPPTGSVIDDLLATVAATDVAPLGSFSVERRLGGFGAVPPPVGPAGRAPMAAGHATRQASRCLAPPFEVSPSVNRAPPDTGAVEAETGPAMLRINGGVAIDGRRLGEVSSRSQVRQASLPASGQSRASVRTASLYAGARIPQ